MKILLRHGKQDDWKMVKSAAYTNEDELQKLLADSPSLISIDDVRPGAGTLVAAVREIPLPIGFVDLLAFSAQGDMAIIECKLAANPEVKRKVIGQALEYGAHIWGMSYADLDEKVRMRSGKSLAELVHANWADPAWDEETFRVNVENALQTGSFILMIVVDAINDDLARIIQFMNACGNPAFSFSALEMRRFQSGDAEMLVPRIVGDTRSVAQVAGAGQRKRWTVESLFEAARQLPKNEFALFSDLFDWSREYAGEVRLGSGKQDGSFTFVLIRNETSGSIFSVYTNGLITINFGHMERIFTQIEIEQFRSKLLAIPGLGNLKDNYYPSIALKEAFRRQEDLEAFKKVILGL